MLICYTIRCRLLCVYSVFLHVSRKKIGVQLNTLAFLSHVKLSYCIVSFGIVNIKSEINKPTAWVVDVNEVGLCSEHDLL